MKKLIAESILLKALLFCCIAILILTTNTRGDVMGWRFTWDNLSGQNHTDYSTDECIGSSLTFHIITLKDNTGSIAFPRWYTSGDWGSGNKNDFDFNETQSLTIEMWKLILLQNEITFDAINDVSVNDRQRQHASGILGFEIQQQLNLYSNAPQKNGHRNMAYLYAGLQ